MNFKLLIGFLLILNVLFFDAYGQNEMVWKKSFGTSKNEVANKIIPTHDGQLLLVGYRQNELGNLDLLVFKLSIDGSLIWEKTYGGPQSEIGYDAVELENGHWMIVGEHQTTTNGSNIYLLEIDRNGIQIAEHSIGGPYNELPKSIFIGTDGNIMIGGAQNIDPIIPSAMLMKMDRKGKAIWTKNINEVKTTPKSTDKRFVMMEEGESANIVIETIDKGFLMAGNTLTDVIGGLATDGWICKLDKDGNKLWSKSFGAFGGDDLKGLFEDDEGNIFVTGENYDKRALKVSMWLLKFSATGELLFEKKFSEGNKFLGGTATIDEHQNIWITGTTFNSERLWKYCSSLSETQQQKYISEGWELKQGKRGPYLEYDYLAKDPMKVVEQIMIAKFDTEGKELWRKLIDRKKEERALSVCYVAGVGVFVTGATYDGEFGMMDVFVLKLKHGER